jgi:hypothetical protein
LNSDFGFVYHVPCAYVNFWSDKEKNSGLFKKTNPCIKKFAP